jgi:uncharacterized protein
MHAPRLVSPWICLLPIAIAGCSGAATPARTAAFFSAIEARDRSRVEAMLDRDPGLMSTRREGVSPVVAAAMARRGQQRFACARANPVLRAIAAREPTLDIFDAALLGDIPRLAALLERNPGLVSARHPFGSTPLHLAAFGGARAAVALLLSRGAALEVRADNRFRNTPLQMSLLCGERDVAAYLLARGADPNARQAEGLHALHEAALLGRVDLIQLLLDHGSDLSPRSDRGETPLGSALRAGHASAAGYLRERGAVE